LINIPGGIQLFNIAAVHYHDPIAEEESLLLIVGDKQYRHMEFFLQLLQFCLHDLPIGGIQSGDGLIQKQNIRIQRQGSGNSHPLLLSAGQLMGPLIQLIHKSHLLQRLPCDGIGIGFGVFPQSQGVADIFQHCHVGKQGIVLENDAHTSLGAGKMGDVPVTFQNRAAVSVV